MTIRECRKGHVVTDDSLDFCPQCGVEGVTVVLSPSRSSDLISSPHGHGGDQAGSTVALLLVIGSLAFGFGAFIIAAATTKSGTVLGWFLVIGGGVPAFIALVAIGASLGFRMSRDR